MSFYYVKSGGTATGDAGRAATARTGSFAAMGVSAYYDSIYDIFTGAVPTTAPVSGDSAYVSSAHNKAHVVDVTLGLSDNVEVVSVDDSNADTYLFGATEGTTAINLSVLIAKTSVGERIIARGIKFIYGEFCKHLNEDEQVGFFYDCEFSQEFADNNYIYASNFDGVFCKFVRCTFNFAHVDMYFQVRVGNILEFDEMNLTGTALKVLFKSNGGCGSHVTVNDSDLSSVTQNISDIAIASNRDASIFKLNRVLIGSGIPINNSTFLQKGTKTIASSIGFGAATDTYHYFENESYVGVASEDTAIYRTLGATYDGTNNFSADLTTNANADFNIPLEFGLGSFYIDTADYTTNITFKVHFAVDGSTVALNSDEFWITVEHADGADNAQGVVVSTQADPLATGTAPTTETSLWTGLGGTNKQMSISKTITIGTSAGNIATGMVKVTAFLGKASQTAYACCKTGIS